MYYKLKKGIEEDLDIYTHVLKDRRSIVVIFGEPLEIKVYEKIDDNDYAALRTNGLWDRITKNQFDAALLEAVAHANYFLPDKEYGIFQDDDSTHPSFSQDRDFGDEQNDEWKRSRGV